MPCHSPSSSLATLHQKIHGISYLYLSELEASVDKPSAFHKQFLCQGIRSFRSMLFIWNYFQKSMWSRKRLNPRLERLVNWGKIKSCQIFSRMAWQFSEKIYAIFHKKSLKVYQLYFSTEVIDILNNNWLLITL